MHALSAASERVVSVPVDKAFAMAHHAPPPDRARTRLTVMADIATDATIFSRIPWSECIHNKAAPCNLMGTPALEFRTRPNRGRRHARDYTKAG
jgi:hypothetical protein